MAELKKRIEENGNGDYTTLEACMNANEQDLTDNGGDYFLAEICGTDLTGDGWDNPDTAACEIDGYTTSETCYIKVYTTASARHDGKWKVKPAYRLADDDKYMLTINDNWVTIEGLQIGYNCTFGAFFQGIKHDAASTTNTVIDQCIVKEGVDGGEYGIKIGEIGGTALVVNTIIIGGGNAGILIDGTSSVTVKHCTVYGAADGIRVDTGNATSVIENTAIFNCTDDIDGVEGVDFCATEDDDGTNPVEITQVADNYAALVTDAAGGDFSITDVDSELYNSGKDAGITDDIIGTARPQALVWDIGGFEYAAAAPEEAGWIGKIMGVTNPAKIMGVSVTDIAKIMGV